MEQDGTELVNEVRLVGRVSAEPERREMPSGDELWTLRVVVPRPEVAGVRRQVDALECVAWAARPRRSVGGWHEGDLVEVEGRLRRRFYTAAGARSSRVEVEVLRGRVIRRARTGRAPRAVASAGTTSP